VASATHFVINGEHFLGFAVFLDDRHCNPSLGATLACITVRTGSSIFKYDSEAQVAYPPSCVGCDGFRGQFTQLQTIPTVGARGMHYFEVGTTGAVHHFLAIAQNRDDDMASVDSAIYLLSGGEFHLFQRIASSYASTITSYVQSGQTFLAVSNRGCPIVSDVSDDFAGCDSASSGGVTLLYYDQFAGRFLPAEDASGSVAKPLRPSANVVAPLPAGVLVFELPEINSVDIVVGMRQFVVVANSGVQQTDEVGASCFLKLFDPTVVNRPAWYTEECWFPADMFLVRQTTADGVATKLAQVDEQLAEQALYLTNLQRSLDGGPALAVGLKMDYDLQQTLFGASSATAFSVGTQQYMVVGFAESYQTVKQCLDRYVNVNPFLDTDPVTNGPALRCAHVGRPLATAGQCAVGCPASLTMEPHATVVDTETATAVYRMELPNLAALGRDKLQAQWTMTQTLPSLGVSDVNAYLLPQIVDQSTYDAGNATITGLTRRLLTVVNARSSCDYDLAADGNLTGEQDPGLGVDVYEYTSDEFVFLSAVRSPCRIVQARPFSVLCQEGPRMDPRLPFCGAYLATVEHCEDAMARDVNWTIPYRVSFHRLNAASQM